MPKRKTTDEFLIEAQNAHGYRYGYNLVEVNKVNEKVKIICPTHGVFEQTPAKHITGRGCPFCAGNQKETTDGFILKAIAIHGTKYDYSKVEYRGNKKSILILCPTHGSFYQTPSDHTNQKSGCPACGSISTGELRKLSQQDFLERAKEKHGSSYDYSETQYLLSTQPVKIICRIHGRFRQLASLHLSGSGCIQCARAKQSELQRSNTDEFINKSKVIHGNTYDYSYVEYQGATNKVKIICQKHGIFEQSPSGHLSGGGCGKCTYETTGDKLRKTRDDFIFQAGALHGDIYDYSKSVYINTNTPLKIICSVHGDFFKPHTLI